MFFQSFIICNHSFSGLIFTILINIQKLLSDFYVSITSTFLESICKIVYLKKLYMNVIINCLILLIFRRKEMCKVWILSCTLRLNPILNCIKVINSNRSLFLLSCFFFNIFIVKKYYHMKPIFSKYVVTLLIELDILLQHTVLRNLAVTQYLITRCIFNVFFYISMYLIFHWKFKFVSNADCTPEKLIRSFERKILIILHAPLLSSFLFSLHSLLSSTILIDFAWIIIYHAFR